MRGSVDARRMVSSRRLVALLALGALGCGSGAGDIGGDGGSSDASDSSDAQDVDPGPDVTVDAGVTDDGDPDQVLDATAGIACADWAAGLDGTGVAGATGSVAQQRAALLAAGGGLAVVGARYYVAYLSPGFATAPRKRVLVDLHGTGGSPEAEWTDFRAELDARGWGFVGLKYLDDTTQIYDTDETVYANLVTLIGRARAGCDLGGAALFLFGFSRGSAKTFALAYLDGHGERMLSGFAANSGGAWRQPVDCAFPSTDGSCAWQAATSSLFPSQCAQDTPAGPGCACTAFTTATPPAVPALPAFASTILASRDTTAYAGSRFWAYCGERDYEGGYRQCGDMEMSKVFVEAFGGHVEELYEAGAAEGCAPWTGTTCVGAPDTRCGHGSLKNQATALTRMWTYLESL